jgi:hypothetical protein
MPDKPFSKDTAMPVFKPRNRLINFRLSEEEFDLLRSSCAHCGARSLSEFARTAVLRSVAVGLGHTPPEDATPDPRVASLDRKVQDLEHRVADIVRLIENLHTADVSSTSSPCPAPVSAA